MHTTDADGSAQRYQPWLVCRSPLQAVGFLTSCFMAVWVCLFKSQYWKHFHRSLFSVWSLHFLRGILHLGRYQGWGTLV